MLVGVNGYFGRRMVDMAGRYGADVRCLEATWGAAFPFEELRAGLEQHRPQVLALVHAETSTGVRQPLEGLAELCQEHDCLLLVDTVTSLGGVPLYADAASYTHLSMKGPGSGGQGRALFPGPWNLEPKTF